MEKKLAPKLARVKSFYDLQQRITGDSRYAQLALVAASNLGRSCRNLEEALCWLRTNAQETSEAGVIAEVNFCRDLVK